MIRRSLAMAMLLVATGCASAPTRYYNLVAQAPPQPHLDAEGVEIILDSVTVPEVVDRMQLVMQVSAVQVRILQHERWSVPLRDQIEAVLMMDLRAALSTDGGVSASESAGRAQPIHLTIDFERLDARSKGVACMAARWQLRRSGEKTPVVGSGTACQPLLDDSPDTLVLAWSQTLSNLSNQVARSIATLAVSR